MVFSVFFRFFVFFLGLLPPFGVSSRPGRHMCRPLPRKNYRYSSYDHGKISVFLAQSRNNYNNSHVQQLVNNLISFHRCAALPATLVPLRRFLPILIRAFVSGVSIMFNLRSSDVGMLSKPLKYKDFDNKPNRKPIGRLPSASPLVPRTSLRSGSLLCYIKSRGMS